MFSKMFGLGAYKLDPDNPKETLELLDFVFVGFKTEKAVNEDKKFTKGDILHLLKAGPTVFRGFIGLKYIDDELNNLSDLGHEKIREKITSFVHDDERTEAFIELVMEWLLKTVQLAAAAIGLMRDDEDDADVEAYPAG